MKTLTTVLAAVLFAAAPVAGSAFAEEASSKAAYSEDVVLVVEDAPELLDPETGAAAYAKLRREASIACMRPDVKGVAAFDVVCTNEMIEKAMAEIRAMAAQQFAEADQ